MKYKLETNIEIIVKGIPKGFVDKNGYRQNYIHATEVNGLTTNKYDEIISYDNDGVMLWNGKRCEAIPMSKEEQEAYKDTLDEAKEGLSKFEEQLKDYDDTVSSLIPELQQDLQDIIDEQIELQIKKFK